MLYKAAYQKYIDSCKLFICKIESSISNFTDLTAVQLARIALININLAHAERQISQLHTRVILGEPVPHDEKVFSIFEPHTEWVSKGKAGVPVEFGLKVCVLNDQHGFVLSHKICQKESDSDIAVDVVKKLQEKYSNISSISFDKGFSSQQNKMQLKDKVDCLVMPKKGKLSKKDKAEQNDKTFIKYRKQHSAVESDINSLEHHGFAKCRNKGLKGFTKYISLSVVAYNLHKVGAIIQEKDLKKLQKKEAKERRQRLAA